MTDVIFQPKVTGSLEAILKNEVAVCGGWVMVRPPAGAVWGMTVALLEADALDEDDPGAGVWVDGDAIVLRAQRRRRRREEDKVRKPN